MVTEFEVQRYTKTVVAAVAAAIAVALTLWTDGEVQKWLQVANAVIGSFGVYYLPNKSKDWHPEESLVDPPEMQAMANLRSPAEGNDESTACRCGTNNCPCTCADCIS